MKKILLLIMILTIGYKLGEAEEKKYDELIIFTKEDNEIKILSNEELDRYNGGYLFNFFNYKDAKIILWDDYKTIKAVKFQRGLEKE